MMDMKRTGELWNRVKTVGEINNLDESAMLTLGGAFGEMKATIKQQADQIEEYKSTFIRNEDLTFKLREQIERYEEALKEIKALSPRHHDVQEIIRIELGDSK